MRSFWDKYYPVGLTLIMVAALAYYTAFYRTPFGNWLDFLRDGLGFFFCTFAYFKFLDVKGFRSLFVQYDIIAMRLPYYGTLYPFVEFGLGLAYLLFLLPLTPLCIFTIIFIIVRAIGIVQVIANQKNIPCGCMGTAALFPINGLTIAANIATIAAAFTLIIYG